MKVPEGFAIPINYSLLVQAYWSSKDQIEIRSSAAEKPHLAVSSTSEEWANTGRTLVLGLDVSVYQ